MTVLMVEIEKKNSNTHTQTSYPVCFLRSWGCVCFGLRFVLEIVWIEKSVSWFWKDGEDGGSELQSVVVWRWWYSLPKKKKRWRVWAPISGGIVYQKKKKEDGGMKIEEWFGSNWWREPLQVLSKVALLWSCSDCGSHVCVFNYQNAMKTLFW